MDDDAHRAHDWLWFAASCGLAGYAVATAAAYTVLYVAVFHPLGLGIAIGDSAEWRAELAAAAAQCASAAVAALAPIVVVASVFGIDRRTHTVALIAALIAAVPAAILGRP